MSRIERRVDELVADDEEMADAIAAVKRVAEEDGGSVEWSDVSEDITSGQWGRMIEKEIVVDDENGAFRLADPEAVETALSGDADTDVDLEIDLDEEPPESDGWSKYDKAAAVGAVLFMAGYQITAVRSVIEGVINPVLTPIDAVLPFYGVILIIALGTATWSTLLQANLMNTDIMQYQQKRMQKLREKQKEAEESGDEAAQEQLREKQMEMMGDQVAMFKEQFKPTVWIMLLTIPIFLWLLSAVNSGGIVGPEPAQVVFPIRGGVDWTTGIIGPMQAWIVWYILNSIAFGQIIRKTIDVQLSTG